ncbi:MAG: hypothetical protein JSS76_18690 [Bacteroidetes bacterium]|nr:hypothetical protein [Bacteroidota bacterium]MBS1686772.1 hypothetical protein [Bacteroidota bacterium]
MRKQDQLVDLIHKLTPAEKKFFKEYTAKDKSRQSFVKLYELLQQYDSYNADLLCRKLGKTKANLAHEKEYLQEILLAALRDYHADMPDIATANIISNVDVLYHKGAYDMARDMAVKALKTAYQHSNFPAAISLYQKLMRITWFDRRDGDKKFEEHDGYTAAVRRILDDIRDLLVLQDMQTRLARTWNTSIQAMQPEDLNQLKEDLQSDILQRSFTQPLFQMLQADLISTIYALTGDRDTALQYKKKVLSIFEKHPRETRVTEHDYLAAVMNVLNHSIGARRPEEAEAFLKKIRTRYYHSLPLDKNFLDKTFEAHYIEAMLSICLLQYPNRGKTQAEAQAILVQFKKTPHPEKDLIPISQLMPYYFAARLSFATEDYDDSLAWFGIVIENADKGSMIDAQIASRISVAAIHCLLGSYTVCRSHALSITKFIKSVRPLTKTEKLMLSFLSNIWSKAYPAEVNKEFIELRDKLATLQQLPDEARIQRMFYYNAWIERNLKKTSRS